MTQLQYIKNDTVSASLAGRSLALNATQVSGLKENFKSKIVIPSTPPITSSDTKTETAPSVDNVIPAPVNQSVEIPGPEVPNIDIAPVTNEVISPETTQEQPSSVTNQISEADAPVIDLGIPFDQGNQIEENKSEEPQTVDVTPIIEIPNEGPVVTESPEPVQTQPEIEIVPNESSKKTEYDELLGRIKTINEEYNKKIADLNAERTQKIEEAMLEAKAGIETLQDKAAEHLKNAQAAEQIAHIAYENAQQIPNV